MKRTDDAHAGDLRRFQAGDIGPVEQDLARGWHQELGQQFETGGFAERIPNPVSSAIYAVYFDYEGDHNNPFSYFIGCKVEPGTMVPAGMDCLMIPSQYYSVVIARGEMPDCLTESWLKIWKSKIDRAYQFDFEVYDDRSMDWYDAEVEIFISSN